MEFKDVVKNRYSCKSYDGRKVEQDKLDRILEAGRLAPTAKNLQEQHIYVVQSEEGLAKIDKVTPCRYNAGTCLLVAFDKNNVYTYPNSARESGVEDATIVATHLMLAAADEGVDSCWLNCIDIDKIKAEFALPDNEDVLMILDLGYGSEGAGPLANHGNRKPLSETVSYL
ncbi:MAG: nitroreductase family protein [Saccharofermentans sp.]|nr:nitroreductase family protein [Saccharofermentans sp.]